MKKKALLNIPKPDENKLAIFYGKDKEDNIEDPPEMSTVDKKTTEDKTSTVAKMTTVVNEDLLKELLRPLVTYSQQAVYVNLYKRSYAQENNITDWVGYGELSKELRISLKTVQRAIDKLININLLKRVELINTAQKKGSKYQIILPLEQKISTVDKMSTEDKREAHEK